MYIYSGEKATSLHAIANIIGLLQVLGIFSWRLDREVNEHLWSLYCIQSMLKA